MKPETDELDSKKYLEDGNISSHIRTKRKRKQLLTKNELLVIHGFDPDEYELKQAVSNEWSVINSNHETGYNFQSKVIVRPKTEEDNLLENILESIEQYTKPFDIECIDDDKLDSTLLINLPDLHIGYNTADEYSKYQNGILTTLENQYENVVICLLGDLFHADNFQSKTIHETRVNDTHIPNSWEEAILFVEPIIQKALATSPNVKLVYTRGNHDETISWAFSKYLEVKYPQCEHDVSIDQLKCVTIDKNAIFLTHGHVKKKNFVQLCATLYPQEWAMTENRMLFTGHFHTLRSEDLTGLVHYQLPTISKNTDYEEEKLFLGSQKGVHLFELGRDKVNAIYYL